MTILSHRLKKIFSSLINSSMKAYLRIRRQMATTLLIPILSFAQLISVPCEGQESAKSPNYSDELPRIPALSPEEAIQRIEVAEGFEIQLVASEPLVQSPVAIEWDASGGMFVCEMRGYSENRDDGISRIRYLEDKNQDGVYDQATVFAEGLLWPTAIYPYKKGLFVADAPNIDYFQDLDGDGVAEKKTTVLTGFSVSNVQGLLNSFRWGLDNRIHVACSSVGGSVHRPGQKDKAVNVRGRDISFDPETFDIQLTSGGAQHGMCFDDWGRKYVSSNSNHIQQVIYEDRYLAGNPFVTAPSARRSMAADGPQAPVFRISPIEPWRIVRTRLRVGGVVPGPIEGGGRPAGYFTGATGVTIYRGDNWGSEHLGTAIIGDVGSNLVHRKVIEQKSIEMTAERIDASSEFIRSSDIWFRPAQFANAPDGTLHIIDVCREVIEHPKSLPPEIKKHLDLNSGRDRGRIFRVIKAGSSPRVNPDLSQLTDEDLVNLLDHPNAWHRETASRLLFESQNTEITSRLISLAKEGSTAQGRLHAMYAIAGLNQLNREVLRVGLSDPHEQIRKHSIRLLETVSSGEGFEKELKALVNDPIDEVRYQLAFSLGAIESKQRVWLLTELAERNVLSPWILLAVNSSLGPDAAVAFARLLSNPSFRSDAAAKFLNSLAQSIVRQNQSESVNLALKEVINLRHTDPVFAIPILGTFRAIARDSPDTANLQKVCDQLIEKACEQIGEKDREASSRRELLNLLSFGSWPKVEKTLIEQATNETDPQLKTLALSVASRYQNETVSKLLVDHWKKQSSEQRKIAIEAIFARPERTELLFQRIRSGEIKADEVPYARYVAAAKSKKTAIKQFALSVLKETTPDSPEDILREYRMALQGDTNSERGKLVFSKHCVGCHRVENQGHQLGPNLSAMKARGPDAILVNILDPNLEVNPQYINYLLLKADGSTSTGMISSENANSITLKRAEGQSEVVFREDIEQMNSSRKSIMPEGLHQSISAQSMADLIAYLMSAN